MILAPPLSAYPPVPGPTPLTSAPGYDMEDAMILNKSSVERGFAHASLYKTEQIDLTEERGRWGCARGRRHVGGGGHGVGAKASSLCAGGGCGKPARPRRRQWHGKRLFLFCRRDMRFAAEQLPPARAGAARAGAKQRPKGAFGAEFPQVRTHPLELDWHVAGSCAC